MQDIWTVFQKNIRSAYTPGRNMCVDETLFGFRGHCAHRQYIQNKQAKLA